MKVSIKPVITSDNYKVICVSGNAGDVLERHKVNESGILLVKDGTVNYQEEGKASITLSQGEGHHIPAEVYHQVTCVNQASIFVMIPTQAKMKFK